MFRTLHGPLAALMLAFSAAPAATAHEFRDCRLQSGPGQPTVGARCTTIEVPLDHADPDGARLGLFVAVVPALTPTPQPDPFTVIAGGPGQGASEFFAAFSGAFGRLQRQRDVLVVDQRGTGQSLRMDCPMPDDPALLAELDQRVPEVVAECLAALPADPRHFTTSAAVRDLELVREALGYPQLNVYGVSYGTRVAQHYARRYPQRTRTLLLDAVVPPETALGPEIAQLAQRSMDAALARCAGDPACAERFPDLDLRLAQLLSALDAEPADITIPDPITGRPLARALHGNDVRATLRMMSYAPETMALVPLLITEAADGHLAPLGSQAEILLGDLEQMLAVGMHNSVVCTEDLPFVAIDEALLASLRRTYLGEAQLLMLERICRHWPAGLLDDDLREPLRSDIPTLILSGELDPITPPAYGERVLSGLSRGLHVVAPGQGHGLAARGCVPRLMDEFVREAAPLQLDAACVASMGPAPFFLDFTGPAP
jgi:pimeloyl-ACP methyl ester carboxylesterase